MRIDPTQKVEEETNVSRHIPGYKGFIPSVRAENKYGESFGRCTNASLSHKIHQGHDMHDRNRFRSTF